MSTSLIVVQNNRQASTWLHTGQHEPGEASTSWLLRINSSLALGVTVNKGLQRLGGKAERQASRLSHRRGLGPMADREAIEALFGEEQDWLEDLKTVADSALQASAQDIFESRGRTRMAPLDELHVQEFGNMQILEAKCVSLLSWAESSAAQRNQLTAFKQIVILVARYPGLRKVFMKHLEVERRCLSYEDLLLFWKSRFEADPNVNRDEWLTYLHKAAHCLLPPKGCCTFVFEIEQQLPSKLGFVELDRFSQRTVIEQLVGVCANFPDSNTRYIAIGYLGGILELPSFWMSTQMRIKHDVFHRLLACAVRILEDEGLCDGILDSTEVPLRQCVGHGGEIDTMVLAILLGKLVWGADQEGEIGNSRCIWLKEYERLIGMIRSPHAASIVPRSQWLVLSRDKEESIWFLPFQLETLLNVDNSHFTTTEANGRRKALLIACTYADSPDEDMHLQNSWKDIESLKQLLKKYGWKEDEMVVLVDRGPNRDRYPTRANILKEMAALVDGACAGDFLFMHFSGHGSQTVATVDKHETDGMDELIWPCDYYALEGQEWNCIIDDTFREILVDKLPIGCKLLGLIDCCSSGTMFDLPNERCFSEPEEVPLFTSPQLSLPCPGDHYRDQRRASTLPPTPTAEPIVARARNARSRNNTAELVGGPPTTSSLLPRRVSERGTNESQRDDISEHNTETAREDLLDTRIILGDVMCISSYPDSDEAYETENGGTLVQTFCNVMDPSIAGNISSMAIEKLYNLLGYHLKEQHDLARGIYPYISAKAPIPQMTFSRLSVDKEAPFKLC